MTDYAGLLRALIQSDVEFIVIGGLAGIGHGSPRFTRDVDVVYSRSEENFAKLVAALGPLQPYLRGAPPGLPFKFDVLTLKRGLNFTFDTSLGEIDILGEVAGGGSYENLLEHSEILPLFGLPCRCLKLEKLIETKRAAGRPKDFEAIAELESLIERRETL